MTVITATAVLVAMAWLSLTAYTAHAQEYAELPDELEVRAQRLYVNTMCPQCSGQTIQQSRAPIAVTMREIIRARLLEGDTDEAITAFLVEAYGDGVLASPPKRGFSAIVWIIPPLGILLGMAAVYLAMRSMRAPGPAPAMGVPAQSASEGASNDELTTYLDLVDSEMGDDMGSDRGVNG